MYVPSAVWCLHGKLSFSTASFLFSRLNSQNVYFLFYFLPEIAFCSWRPGNTEICVFPLLPTQHARSLFTGIVVSALVTDVTDWMSGLVARYLGPMNGEWLTGWVGDGPVIFAWPSGGVTDWLGGRRARYLCLTKWGTDWLVEWACGSLSRSNEWGVTDRLGGRRARYLCLAKWGRDWLLEWASGSLSLPTEWGVTEVLLGEWPVISAGRVGRDWLRNYWVPDCLHSLSHKNIYFHVFY
jgi:hypothetical protein